MGAYIDRCVPFQIMSNQLNLPQVDSNQVVETSERTINGNRMHRSSISSIIAKALNSYVNTLFLFFFLFTKMSKNLILLCHYGVLGVD